MLERKRSRRPRASPAVSPSPASPSPSRPSSSALRTSERLSPHPFHPTSSTTKNLPNSPPLPSPPSSPTTHKPPLFLSWSLQRIIIEIIKTFSQEFLMKCYRTVGLLEYRPNCDWIKAANGSAITFQCKKKGSFFVILSGSSIVKKKNCEEKRSPQHFL